MVCHQKVPNLFVQEDRPIVYTQVWSRVGHILQNMPALFSVPVDLKDCAMLKLHLWYPGAFEPNMGVLLYVPDNQWY